MDIFLLYRVVQHLLTVLSVLLISFPQSVEADPHSLETLAKLGDQIELTRQALEGKEKGGKLDNAKKANSYHFSVGLA
ncbi:MAG: hypothetical protein ACR2PH_12580 [Desulfobulbia bacterium]